MGFNSVFKELMALAIINKERMLGEKLGGLLRAYYAKATLSCYGFKIDM